MNKSFIQDIVTHAYKTVPFYKNLFNDLKIDPSDIKAIEDLGRLPILSKDKIQAHPNRFVSSDSLAYPQNQNLTVYRTSGSTGRFLNIYWTKQDYIRSLFHLWVVRNRVYGIKPSSKFCTFHSGFYVGEEAETPEVYMDNCCLGFSKLTMDDEHLQKYYTQIINFEPEWFFIQPSVAYILAKFIKENKLETPRTLKYIELSGEYVFPSYKRMIMDTFSVPVVNMYGCMETNGIAIGCPRGKLHCLSDNVIIEILNNGEPVGYGEEGQIHLTSLMNRAMPFIRYDVGDRGILYPSDSCDCGDKNPVLDVLAGRVCEYVRIKGREPINAFIFHYAVERINVLQGYPVIQFQVIQESYEYFKVVLSLQEDLIDNKESIKKQFMDEMAKLQINHLCWDIEFVDRILPNFQSGKLQFFVCKIKD